MTFGSLFAGVGGFDLGFERAGLRCAWQVEIAESCRSVLEDRWPDVRRLGDVREFPPPAWERCECCEDVICTRHGIHLSDCDCPGIEAWAERNADPYSEPDIEAWRVDVICGGFPCQDVSNAGKREGIDGERSGLWSEYVRVLGVLRPRFAVVENTAGLSVRGFDRVLGDLAEAGFDAEWATLPAGAFGAAHRRERLFVVAYAAGLGLEGRITAEGALQEPTPALDHLHDWPAVSEPFGIRTFDGVPAGVDRINALGNAVVPHVAEWLGRRLRASPSGGVGVSPS